MALKIVFRRIARTELREAKQWYDARQPGLGKRFVEAVEQKLKLIEQNPTLYRIAHRDTREAIVDGWPYVIYYRIETSRIVIIAVFHGRRDPTIWRDRADDDSQ